MSNEEIVNKAIPKFKDECSQLPKDEGFVEKVKMREELIIKSVIETLLDNN